MLSFLAKAQSLSLLRWAVVIAYLLYPLIKKVLKLRSKTMVNRTLKLAGFRLVIEFDTKTTEVPTFLTKSSFNKDLTKVMQTDGNTAQDAEGMSWDGKKLRLNMNGVVHKPIMKEPEVYQVQVIIPTQTPIQERVLIRAQESGHFQIRQMVIISNKKLD